MPPDLSWEAYREPMCGVIQDTANALPSWLGDSLTTEPEDGVLNKRTKSRHTWTVVARATLLGDIVAKQFLVKTFNVSLDGVALITRIPLREIAEIWSNPVDGVMIRRPLL